MAKQVAERTKEEVAEQIPPPKYRRNVGTKETVGFIAFEAARDVPFRLGQHQEWIDRTLNLSRDRQALGGIFIGVGDIINDLYLATIIEKIRTRFGKFRPLLVAFPIYALPVTIIMALLPVFFWGTPETLMAKFVVWVVMRLFTDIADTIWNIATMGMVANITPDPQERISLITKAKFLSFGSSFVGTFRDILRDVISNRSISDVPAIAAGQIAARELAMRRLFAIFGIGTIALGAGLGLYFAAVSKERVLGSANVAKKEKPPSLRESMQALWHNRPLLMVVLHEVLEGVRVNDQLGTYTSSILNFTNFGTVFGIPGAIISPISYSYVRSMRERISTKNLWILSRALPRPIRLIIHFIGMIPTARGTPSRGDGRYTYYRLYARLGPMIGAFMVYDMVAMSLWGARQVIPDEIRNECIDYGEWKSGFRSEAMVGVMRGVPGKLMGIIGRVITDFLMHIFGFQTGGDDILDQNPTTADRIWLMTNLVPESFALLSIIPQFFYNINQKERAVMYLELAERRAAALEAQKQFALELENEIIE